MFNSSKINQEYFPETQLEFTRININARRPMRFGDGVVLFSSHPGLIGFNEIVGFRTGLTVKMPRDHYGKLSGINQKLANGMINLHDVIIPSDYGSEIIIHLENKGSEFGFRIEKYFPIAVLTLHKIQRIRPVVRDIDWNKFSYDLIKYTPLNLL